jgi:hypothetical protein
MASLAAESAASCAAKGVLFLEPFCPIFPALAQDITCPSRSVKVTIVLLKLALICATPTASTRLFFLRTLRLPVSGGNSTSFR